MVIIVFFIAYRLRSDDEITEAVGKKGG